MWFIFNSDYVVVQIKPCPKPPHRPKLGDHRWYSLKALLDWADNLGRWEGLGHSQVWATTLITHLLIIHIPSSLINWISSSYHVTLLVVTIKFRQYDLTHLFVSSLHFFPHFKIMYDFNYIIKMSRDSINTFLFWNFFCYIYKLKFFLWFDSITLNK